MSSGYLESGLSESAADIHRALASLQEELEAVDYYHQRADRTQDAAVRSIVEHNRDEEIEHAAMLLDLGFSCAAGPGVAPASSAKCLRNTARAALIPPSR